MPTEIRPNNMACFGKTFLPLSSAWDEVAVVDNSGMAVKDLIL